MCRLLSDQKKSSYSLFLTLQEDQWRRGAVGEQVLHLSPQSRPPPPTSQSRRKPCTRQSSCWEEVGQRRPLLSSLILNCWVKQEGAYHHQKGSRQFFAFQPLERSLVPNNSVFSDNDDILYRLLFDMNWLCAISTLLGRTMASFLIILLLVLKKQLWITEKKVLEV